MSYDSIKNEIDKTNQDLLDTYCSTCKDFLKETFRESGLVEPLRRVILIGRLKYADRSEVKTHHDDMVKNIGENIVDKSSKPSGLMIIDKSVFYHIAEGSDEALNEIIESTTKFVSMKLLYGAKVIRISSVAFRYFENYYSCVILSPEYVDLPLEAPEFIEGSDIPALAHMIEKLEDEIFVLASYVRYLEPAVVEEKINDLVPTSVLPHESELKSIYREPFFITVQKYTERYLSPQDYTSYIEQEWPPTGPVHDSRDYFEQLEVFEANIDEFLQKEEGQKKKKTIYGLW